MLGDQLLVEPQRFLLFQRIADTQTAFAGVGDLHVVEDVAVAHAAIRRLDKAVFVDARKARERADQADVRTFRRLNRADTAVVRRVYVAHFKACTLSAQTTRPKGGKPPLVGDLRQRIGLIHELRQLRGAEEFADGRHHRLGVDQVVRHGRRHFLIHAHLFLDGALHAHQADAELVLHQLADGAHAAVAKVIDVVHYADVLAQLEQVTDGPVEVFRRQGALVELGRVLRFVELDVELQAAYAGEVVLARIEEHAFEQRSGGIERRRIARTQLAVDLDQRFLRLAHRVAAQGVGDDVAHIVAIGEEDLERRHAALGDLVDLVRGQLVVGLEQHFAGGGVDHVGQRHGAIELRGFDLDRGDLVIAQRLEDAGRDLAAGVGNLFALDHDGVRRLGTQQVGSLVRILADLPGQLAVVHA